MHSLKDFFNPHKSMENITLAGPLSQEIFNQTQKYTGAFSRPHQFNFREIIRGLLLGGSTHLSRIGRVNGAASHERKTVERLSNTLKKIPVETLAAIHVQSQVHQYQHEPVLLLSDGGDLQKPYARKMEKVGPSVDGSHGHKAGTGYPLHGLMVLGTESQTLNPLALRVYSTLEENFKSGWDEERKSFELLHPLIRSSKFDRIVVEDRGCDDEKRFLYFMKELECSFVTRIHAGAKSRRFFVQNGHGELEIMKTNELAETLKPRAGSGKTWWNQKLKKELVSRIAFEQVYLPHHPDVPLYAIFCYSEGYEEPLVILTDLETDSFEKAWKHFFYYKKRWEVENFYRAIKQQFGAEAFLVLDFEKIKALLFCVMLAYSLLLKLREKMKEFLGLLFEFFKEFCRRRQKNAEHHLDLLAFLRDYFAGSETRCSYRFYSRHFRKFLLQSTKNQLRLFNTSKIW